MNLSTLPSAIPQRSSRLVAAGFGIVAAFHFLLALGAPWGRATLGGTIDGTLPPELRVASSVSMVIFIGAAFVILGRTGHWGDRFARAFRVGTWALVVILVLSSLLNLASSSPWERFGWAPFTVLLAISTFVVARRR